MNPLRDNNLLRELLALREKDPNTFANMVLGALKNYPDIAMSDEAPVEHKKRALEKLLKHFENIENYEDCAFILDLKKQIENASKE